ncbi:MAG TPA: hypothetical protein PK398_02800 [Candidatus Gracilibacteria bacterium]|nr:hypothetical protein [Candidatus Gracilibacteria bacterium]
MQSKNYSKYYPFIFVGLIVLSVVVSVFSAAYVYFGIDDVEATNESEVLEVKLPIMSWSQYSVLSKKYQNGIVLPDRKLMDGENVENEEAADDAGSNTN